MISRSAAHITRGMKDYETRVVCQLPFQQKHDAILTANQYAMIVGTIGR